MTALSARERDRYHVLRRKVVAAIEHVAPTAIAFQLRLNESISTPDVAEWMSLEHRCCPFLTLAVALKDDGTRWIEIGGSEAIKAFLEDEFRSFTRG